MIAYTGHRLDGVVCLTVDQDEIVSRLLQRAQVEGRADDTEDVIRRRQEVYLEQTEPLTEVYKQRGIVVEVDGMGDVDDVTVACSRPWTASPSPGGPARPRVEIKTPQQVVAMRRAGLVVGRTLELLRASVRAGISTGELDAIAEDHIRSSGRPVVPGATTASARSAPRSTTRSCTASPATGCWPTATWSPSTAERSFRTTPGGAGTAMPRSPSRSARSPTT